MSEARNTVNVPVAGSPRCEVEAVQAIGRLKASLASPDCAPQFGNITLTDLTASQLVATDSDKAMESIAMGTGLSLAASLSLQHLGLEDLTDPGGDRIFFWDDSESKSDWLVVSTGLQISGANLLTKDSEIVHDDLSGFVADEHVAHSGVTITAGTGLTGGGTIDSNVTIDCNIGTDLQAHGDVLDDFNTLGAAASDGQFIVATGEGVFQYESGATLRTSIGVDAAGTAAGLVGTHESTYNHTNYNTAYSHSQLGSGNPHSVTPTELSLVIGTNTQAWDADLAAIAALAKTDGNFIVGNGSAWVAESGATARTSIGLGTGDSPEFTNLDLTGQLDITNNAVSFTSSYYSFNNLIVKTGGASGVGSYLFGENIDVKLDQVGGTVGYIIGSNIYARIDDGNIGDTSNSRTMHGQYVRTDLNGGKVWGNVYGLQFLVDQEASNEITGNVYGLDIFVDCDGTVGGNVFNLHLADGSNVDYNIFSTSTADSYFAGKIGIGTSSPKEHIHVTGKLRANTAFNHNGTDGVTNTDAGVITDIDVSGGIVTSITKSVISHQTLLNISSAEMAGDSDAQLVAGDIGSTSYTHKGRVTWSFDATTEQAAITRTFAMPQGINGYGGGTLHATLYLYMASDNTNDIAMDVFVEAVTPNADTLDMEAATSWGAANTGTVSLAGTTAGDLIALDVTLTNDDGVEAGDLVRFGIRRDCDSADDDASGDIFLVTMEIWEA